MAPDYERLIVNLVSVVLIIGGGLLHALHLSDPFTDDLTLIAVGALYMGVVPARRPPGGPPGGTP